jgi:F-type H+-transporting ATPase subunit delta
LKRQIRLHCEVDASLIGGAIVRAGDFVIDGSLRARLERLAGAMTH